MRCALNPYDLTLIMKKEAAIPRKNDRLPQRLLCLILSIVFRSSQPPRYILSGIALPSEQ